jgi:hypothetical protein
VGGNAVHRPADHAGARQVAAAAILLAFASAIAAHDLITTRVTWYGDVAPIVEARCVKCHAPGGRGPMPLTTYEQARPWARAIKEEVLTRRMPKWHAARGYGAFANDPSLSPFEIALIAAWVDGGAPRGSGAPQPHSEQPQPPADATRKARDVSVPCRSQRLPAGSLVAVQPVLAPGRSIGLAVLLPDRTTEVVAWIRDFDPKFPEVYRLRTGIDLPGGSRLVVETDDESDGCRIALTVAPPR